MKSEYINGFDRRERRNPTVSVEEVDGVERAVVRFKAGFPPTWLENSGVLDEDGIGFEEALGDATGIKVEMEERGIFTVKTTKDVNKEFMLLTSALKLMALKQSVNITKQEVINQKLATEETTKLMEDEGKKREAAELAAFFKG